MGNNVCGVHMNTTLEEQMERIRLRDPTQPLTLDKLRQLSKYYITSRNIKNQDVYYVDMLVSIRQVHLAQHLRNLEGPAKQEFIAKLKSINFEELDIMSNQALVNKQKRSAYKKYSQKETLTVKYKLDNQNELYAIGSSVIKNRAVGVLVPIGCFGKNPNPNTLSCLKELHIPSRKSCLQLYLERISYLNENNNSNIPVILLVESKYQQVIVNWVRNIELNLNLIIKSYKASIPNVSLSGQILMENQNNFSYAEGKGDFLREINRLGILQNLVSRNIEYLHICRPTNILQKVADPFTLGYMQQNKLDVVSKLIPFPKDEQSQTGNLFLVQSPTEKVCIKSNVPKQTRKYVFINSVFMRLSYLQSLTKQLKFLVGQKMRCKQIKTSYYDPINQQFVFSSTQNAMYFYRNPSDLIVGNNYKFLIVAEEFEYSNINLNPFPQRALSNFFKHTFGIQHTKDSELIEISPLIFYDSNEGLSDIKRELESMKEIGYPCEIKKLE